MINPPNPETRIGWATACLVLPGSSTSLPRRISQCLSALTIEAKLSLKLFRTLCRSTFLLRSLSMSMNLSDGFMESGSPGRLSEFAFKLEMLRNSEEQQHMFHCLLWNRNAMNRTMRNQSRQRFRHDKTPVGTERNKQKEILVQNQILS